MAGPTVAILWDTGAAGAIGAPIGSETVRVLELLGYFYALGAAVVAFAALALGRLSIVGIRDLEAATAATDVPDERADDEADATDPAPTATGEGDREDGTATRRSRLLRRS